MGAKCIIPQNEARLGAARHLGRFRSELLEVKVTRPSYFVGVPTYFEALWYPHLYSDRKSNI